MNIEELSGWKQEKPTVPGAYWQKGHMLDEPELVGLLRIEEMDGELCVVDNEDASDHRAALSDWRNDFFWIGPLTEQAETHTIELRAYEATVQNLEQRIRQLKLELLANGEAQRVPDGWKLVPVEPTQEMVCAAEEAHMPFGDMDLALRMAILSAPDHIADAAPKKEPRHD